MLALLCLASQDLWDRVKESHAETDRGRVEYRLGPAVSRGGGKVEAARVDFDFATNLDFACGRFDLKTSFGSVINKDIAGQMMGAALDQLRDKLAGSAMVLACQMSPTLCDVMKHFRVTANDLLGKVFEDCRSIEQEAGGATRPLKARALMACLAEKQAAGAALDDALAACKSANEVQGLAGERTREVDLLRELSQTFKLKPEAEAIVKDLLDAPKLGASGSKGNVKLRAVDAAYERARDEALVRLKKAVDSGDPKGAAPASLPALTQADLDMLKTLDEPSRRNVLAVLAGAHALVEISRTIHDVEALLEAAAALADDPSLREAFERQSARLDRELRRLREAGDIESGALHQQARALAAAREDRDEKIRKATGPARSAQEMKRLESSMRFPACPDTICPKKGEGK
jgi:hypothetical protein